MAGPPMIFHISAAKELALFTLVKRAQTTLAVLRIVVPPKAGLPKDTLNAQAPLAKISNSLEILPEA